MFEKKILPDPFISIPINNNFLCQKENLCVQKLLYDECTLQCQPRCGSFDIIFLTFESDNIFRTPCSFYITHDFLASVAACSGKADGTTCQKACTAPGCKTAVCVSGLCKRRKHSFLCLFFESPHNQPYFPFLPSLVSDSFSSHKTPQLIVQ